MNRFFRSALFPLFVIVLLVYLASQTLIPHGKNTQKVTYSEFRDDIPAGKIASAEFNPSKRQISGKLTDGKKYSVHYPADQSVPGIETSLLKASVQYDSKGTGNWSWIGFFTSLLPFVLLFAFWIFLMNQVQGGGSKVMSFGKSRAKRMAPDSPKIGFKDVAGVDEAVEELHEIKEFLENPKKFQALGARIPKGVLLYGPPGTGKTLLARAVAGEAGVPFFSISGSDFVEMFVGVGASRVRDLFEQAKQAAPCIVFMDEIDAVGRHRGAGLGGGHDEREQTLNQLLVEMDGFELKDNIILIAATNRPDILDPALLRPGRFDRQIVVDRPDRVGRRKILEVHANGHALVGHYLEHTDEVHKISVISRGQALGYTISLPREDRYLTTKTALMEQLAMTLGGRAAEELVFHEVTTGAANDLEKVTSISKQMIMRYGMSDKLGPRVLGRNHDMPFLGREMGNEPDYSEEIAREIDDEIRRVIEEAHETALRVLREHMEELHKIAGILIERETIDKDQFERLLAGAPEEEIFAEDEQPEAEAPADEPKRLPKPKPRPFPLPGATMQPPPPEGAKG